MTDKESDADFVERMAPKYGFERSDEHDRLISIARRAVTAEAERDAAIRTCAVLQKDFDEVSKEQIVVTPEAVRAAALSLEQETYTAEDFDKIKRTLQAAAPLMRGREVKRYEVGQSCTVPECVCSTRDSVLPVGAVVKEVKPDGRYVVRARGENLWVTHDEITPKAAAPLMRGGENFGTLIPADQITDANLIAPQPGELQPAQPTPTPSCPSMPEQRVSDVQLSTLLKEPTVTSDETREAANVARKMLALGINIQALGEVTNQTIAGALRATIAHIDELEADLKGALAVGQYAVKETRRQALEEAAQVCEAIAAADEASRMHAVRVRDANAPYLLWAVQARQNDAEAIRALIDKPTP